MAEADTLRDKLFSSIKLYLKGYKGLEVLPNYQDADALYQLIKNYGLAIDRLSYAEDTAQMKKLIEELEQPDNTAKLAALNLTEVFDKMKTAQQAFEALYAEQAEANADLRSLPSASAIRKDLEKALRNYFNLLTAMKNVPGWEMIYADIHELVKSAKNS